MQLPLYSTGSLEAVIGFVCMYVHTQTHTHKPFKVKFSLLEIEAVHQTLPLTLVHAMI